MATLSSNFKDKFRMIVSMIVSNFVEILSGINDFTLNYRQGAANFGTWCMSACA